MIYYNHFKHGFNRSQWSQFSIIDQYQSLQLGLEDTAQMRLSAIETGYEVGPSATGPIPGEYPGSSLPSVSALGVSVRNSLQPLS